MQVQKHRYLLVALGLVAFEAIMAMRPAGDLNGDVAMFPHATIWFVALLLSWGAVMTGMFSVPRGRKFIGPLVLGTVGSAVVVAANL